MTLLFARLKRILFKFRTRIVSAETMKARKVVGVEQHNYKKKKSGTERFPLFRGSRVSVTLKLLFTFSGFCTPHGVYVANCTSLICNEEAGR